MSLIALGVSGGVGAYKAVDVARGLQKRGHDVAVVMTRAAQQFVGPLTFEAITRRRVMTDQFAPGLNADIEHIALAAEAHLLLVAPATANVIGKFANGIADDFLSSLYLATRAPVLMAPAMNTLMLEHEAVRRNLETLAARGVRFVDPGTGYLACGWIGKGRLAEPDDIVAAADALLRPASALGGRRILVTAGPTYEDIDPVRYLGNRSSGRMGVALAAEASRRGARVTLVAGPTTLPLPAGMEQTIRVRNAGEMFDAVINGGLDYEAVVMAAAVADYTTAEGASPMKLSKDSDTLTLTLVRTRDVLGELGRRRGDGARPVLVGFAAETHDVLARARAKLAAKHADLIVANDVSRADAGFEVDTNVVTLIARDGEQALPVLPKAAVAGEILDRVEQLLSHARQPSSRL